MRILPLSLRPESSYAGVPWLVQIVGNEAEQKCGVAGCQKFAIWRILMKNDGMLSAGKPGHVGEKVTKIQPR